MNENILLSVKDLTIHYKTDAGVFKAVNDVSFTLDKGETMGLVGETGAGKTTTALGLMRLVPDPPGKIINGEILYNGVNLLEEGEISMRKYRGNEISMIFQDPMTALNPVITVGEQIAEAIRLHDKSSRVEAEKKTAALFEIVGIPADRMTEYPHQFSGGMKQRVVIAMALCCNPSLIVADEPTTALDVTIQAQVLDLIQELQKKLNTAMILITHDLGVVAEVCDKVAIMYAGEIVESGSLDQIFNHTKHPYTIGLFGAIPKLTSKVHRLTPINGMMPDPSDLPKGCSFAPRCPYKTEECEKRKPGNIEMDKGHSVKCIRYEDGKGLKDGGNDGK